MVTGQTPPDPPRQCIEVGCRGEDDDWHLAVQLSLLQPVGGSFGRTLRPNRLRIRQLTHWLPDVGKCPAGDWTQRSSIAMSTSPRSVHLVAI